MIFFISSRKNQNLISQVIHECGESVIDNVCEDNLNLLHFVTANMSIIDSADILIFDLTACEDSDDDIVQALENIRVMNDKVRIIVVDATRYEGDAVLAKCFSAGIYDLIVTDDNVEFKESLEFSITKGRQYKDATEFRNYIPYAEYAEKKNRKPDAEDVVIGIAGTHARIGVTHAMIVLGNCLRKKGYLVAMLDYASNPSFSYIKNSFDCEEKEYGFVLDGMHYYMSSDMEDVKGKGYNFILADFGEYEKRDAEIYLKCDRQIIIAGAKPWEVEKTVNVFQDTTEENLKKYHYYFNFVADDLKDEVRTGMDVLKAVHFLEYAEDPFNAYDFPDIRDLICDYKEPEQVAEKKRKLFKRGIE